MLCEVFGLPQALRKKKTTPMALLMIVASHRITRKKRLVPAARAFMGKYSSQVWNDYLEVFSENSRQQRVRFFSDKLI